MLLNAIIKSALWGYVVGNHIFVTEKPFYVKIWSCKSVHTTIKTPHNSSWHFERWSPKNTSKQSLQKSNSLNSSFWSNQATFKNSFICDFDLSATLALILCRAKTWSASVLKSWDDSAWWRTILSGLKQHALWINQQTNGHFSANLTRIFRITALQSPRNFLFFSSETLAALNFNFVAAATFTKPFSNWCCFLFNQLVLSFLDILASSSESIIKTILRSLS